VWNTGTCRQNLRCRSVRDCESYGNDDEGADAARWKDRKFNAVLQPVLFADARGSHLQGLRAT